MKAPYFATIAPRFLVLTPGRCEIAIRDRRRVHNHIGTVHAIALCNLAELCAGMMTDVTIPAVATPEAQITETSTGQRWPVKVSVRNDAGEEVFLARINMWVSPRKRD